MVISYEIECHIWYNNSTRQLYEGKVKKFSDISGIYNITYLNLLPNLIKIRTSSTYQDTYKKKLIEGILPIYMQEIINAPINESERRNALGYPTKTMTYARSFTSVIKEVNWLSKITPITSSFSLGPKMSTTILLWLNWILRMISIVCLIGTIMITLSPRV